MNNDKFLWLKLWPIVVFLVSTLIGGVVGYSKLQNDVSNLKEDCEKIQNHEERLIKTETNYEYIKESTKDIKSQIKAQDEKFDKIIELLKKE